MPTFLRSSSLSNPGSLTSWPSTVIEPFWMSFKALTQRIRVDLPDPDGPMMQMHSPFMMSMETPFSTSRSPNDLCTSLIETMGWSGVHAVLAAASFMVKPPYILTANFFSSRIDQRAIG